MKTICLSILTVLFFVNTKGFSNTNTIRFTLSGNGYSDETIIRMLDGATESFDGSYDAWKLFSPNPSVPSIYSRIAPSQELAINSLPEYTSDKSIVLFVKIPVTGYYTIHIQEIYPIMPKYSLSLTDLSSNVHFQIFGDTTITLYLVEQQDAPILHFNIYTKAIVSKIDETCSANNDGVLSVTKLGNTDWSCQILDGNGTIVADGMVSAETITYSNLVPDNYLIRISSFGINEVQSITINSAPFFLADFDLMNDTLLLSEGATLGIINNSTNATAYFWDFGDGNTSSGNNPSHTYFSEGLYNIKLIAYNNNCSKELEKTVVVVDDQTLPTAINEAENQGIQMVALGQNRYKILVKSVDSKIISLYSLEGKVVFSTLFNSNQYQFSLSEYDKGLYVLTVVATTERRTLLKVKLVN